VDLSGERIIAGAQFHDAGISNDNAGEAYVWHLQNGVWNQAGLLVPAGLQFGDNFGSDVAIAGDIALVGSNHHDKSPSNLTSDEGSASMFAFDGSAWVELEQFGASDASSGALFGRAVELDGDRIMIGSSNDFGTLTLAGGVYEYTLDSNLGRAVSYNGSGTNPVALVTNDRPITGVTWEGDLLTSAFPAAIQSLVFVYGGQLQVSTPLGELLVDPSSGLLGSSVVLSSSGLDAHTFPIPADPTLLGFPAFAQGAVADGSFHLTNGIALTIGQ